MKPAQTHSIKKDGMRYKWKVETLWRHAATLEPFEYDVSTFTDLDEDCWFGDRHEPTIRRVLEHHERIQRANYTHPIILSEDNVVMDGIHRICKALLDGKATIPAVKFQSNPEPDAVEPMNGS